MNWRVIILSSMGLLLLVMFIDLYTQTIETRNRMMERYLLSVQEFYVAIQDQIRQLHRCRHDLAKHIQIIEMLQENGQEILQDYAEKLREEYRRQRERGSRYCSHEVVNMILLLKERQCQSLELPFAAAVEDVSLEGVGNLDWVGLLCNLLDNAIEASQRLPGPWQKGVSLCLKEEAGMLVVTVENQVPQGKSLSFSTRKDRKLHGYGLEIIDGIVDKYHGKRTVTLDKNSWRLCTRCALRGGEQAHG